MEVEVRISSDGNSVAIRSEHAEDAWNAWGVMNRQNGGHWAKTSQVTDGWLKVTATEPVPAPEPEPPVE